MSLPHPDSPTQTPRERITILPDTRPGGMVVLVLLALWVAFVIFYKLGSGDLYRNETLRAIIAAEFLHSGNWIIPTLYGEPLFTKPPGMYAAIALASLPAGHVSEFTARLPSAIAGCATVVLFYWHFRRQLGPLAGLVAGAALPLSFMWLDKSGSAEIDMLLLAWVTAAMICFLRLLKTVENLENQPPKSISLWIWWGLALLCVAGGVLTKWTAPIFFYGTVMPLLWWRGRLSLLFSKQHLLSATLGAVICFAWAGTAVSITGWETVSQTIAREAVMHLQAGHHQRPPWWALALSQPIRILVAGLPMSFFALLTLRPTFAACWNDAERRLLQALHCWTWPNFILWTLLPAHGIRQCLPIWPGMAGLAAMVWVAWLSGRLSWPIPRLPPQRVLAGILFLWLFVKIGFVHVIVPMRSGDGPQWVARLTGDSGHRRLSPRMLGEQVAGLVPFGEKLYLFRLKDEGVMFYYGRSVQRLACPEQLPSPSEPMYCILDESEWKEFQTSRPIELVCRLNDSQGAPIVLAKTKRVEDSLSPHAN